jgi:hypothetical protein
VPALKDAGVDADFDDADVRAFEVFFDPIGGHECFQRGILRKGAGGDES